MSYSVIPEVPANEIGLAKMTSNMPPNNNIQNTNQMPTIMPIKPNLTIETQTSISINLDSPESDNIITSNDLNSISNYVVFDEIGNRHQISEIWSE